MSPNDSVYIEDVFYLGAYFKWEGVACTLKGIEDFIHSLFIFTAIESLTLSEFSSWPGLDLTSTVVLHSLGRGVCSLAPPRFTLHLEPLTTRWVKQVLALVTREHLEDIKSCSGCPFLRFVIL